MSNIEKLQEIVRKLHEINFGADGIIHPDDGGEDYDFSKFLEKTEVREDKVVCKHQYSQCGNDNTACRKCEAYKDALKKDEKRFTYVAHGTHTLDFIEAHTRVNGHDIPDKPIDISHWSVKPVMFVLENPSNCSGNEYLKEDEENKYPRLPTRDWFWLDSLYNQPASEYIYPNYFVTGSYGGMIFSVMNTFHIANGYVTDSVKCGIGLQKNVDEVSSTSIYHEKIIETCVKENFSRELKALRDQTEQKVIVFAFGVNAYNNIRYSLSQKDILVLLPHPANRNISNDQYKYVLFTKIAKTLHENAFYNGVDEIDYFEILKRDQSDYEKSKVPKPIRLKNIKEILQDVFDNCLYEQASEYKDGVYTWKIPYAKKEESRVDNIIIKYRRTAEELQSQKNGKDEYKVFWANYDIPEDKIYLWRGKRKSESDEPVEIQEEREKIELYKKMLILQEKLKNRP